MTNAATADEARARGLQQWRWEFLRRRSDYRADWDRVHRDWQERQLREYSNIPLPAGVSSWFEHFRDIASMPNDEQRQKYSVSHLVNPTREWSPNVFVAIFLSRTEQLRDAVRRELTAEPRTFERRFETLHALGLAAHDAQTRAGILTIYVDTAQPIPPQIQRAKIYAERVQNELNTKRALSNRRPHEWELYLRMLDLEGGGKSLSEIAAVVYPSMPNAHANGYPATKKARAALRRAHFLQDTLAVGR